MPTMKIEGLPVKDGRKSIVLHITPGDVKKARKKDPSLCAAALGCVRDLGASKANVHTSRTYIKFNGHWERYLTSPALRAEIVAFDRGGQFEPGDYMLLKMQPSRQTDKHRSKPGGGRGKKRKPYHTLTNVRPRAA